MATIATATSVTSINSSTDAVTLAMENPHRVGVILFNASAQTLFVKYGTDASADDYTFQLVTGQGYESPAAPIYRGVITGAWAAVDGACKVTQLF